MNKILELREKRAKAWEAAKAFLDSAKREGNILSSEDVTTYEKMEADIVALGREIEILERQAQMELELNAAVNTPIKNAPKGGGADAKTGRASENYKESYWKYMRNKNSTTEVLNALQIGGDDGSEGGYLVPDEYEATLIDGLTEENIIRQIANVISTSFGERKIPVVAGHGSAAWTDEEAALTESDDSFGMVTLGAHKLATIIKVSEELINDSVFGIENYLAREFARRMASAEEEAFITGNGTGKPTGILVNAEVGVTSAADALKCDELIDLYHSLKTPYRKKAVFITNDSTVKAIRKLKDNSGNYLWQPSLTAGTPDTILNRPIKTSGFVPTIAAGAKAVLFGDFSYYWIADRQGRSFQRLNELYAENGQVGFKASQRVDGKLTLNEAVKILQMKTA